MLWPLVNSTSNYLPVCDGLDDAQCPGLCSAECLCQGVAVPAMGRGGHVLLVTILLLGAFSLTASIRRRLPS